MEKVREKLCIYKKAMALSRISKGITLIALSAVCNQGCNDYPYTIAKAINIQIHHYNLVQANLHSIFN